MTPFAYVDQSFSAWQATVGAVVRQQRRHNLYPHHSEHTISALLCECFVRLNAYHPNYLPFFRLGILRWLAYPYVRTRISYLAPSHPLLRDHRCIG